MWTETVTDNPETETDVLQGELTPITLNPKLAHDIHVLVTRLVGKAHKFIGNVTTNLADGWMHMRSKFDGGKVIKSGSWEHHSMGAGLTQNLGKEWGPQAWKIPPANLLTRSLRM